MSRLIEYAALVATLLVLSVAMRLTVLPLVTASRDVLHVAVAAVERR